MEGVCLDWRECLDWRVCIELEGVCWTFYIIELEDLNQSWVRPKGR